MTYCCIHTSDIARRQHLRSAGCRQLFVPRHRRSMLGHRAFSVAGPAAWNSLPDYLRDPSRSFDSFRRDLKTFLFSPRNGSNNKHSKSRININKTKATTKSIISKWDFVLYKSTIDIDSDTDILAVSLLRFYEVNPCLTRRLAALIALCFFIWSSAAVPRDGVIVDSCRVADKNKKNHYN